MWEKLKDSTTYAGFVERGNRQEVAVLDPDLTSAIGRPDAVTLPDLKLHESLVYFLAENYDRMVSGKTLSELLLSRYENINAVVYRARRYLDRKGSLHQIYGWRKHSALMLAARISGSEERVLNPELFEKIHFDSRVEPLMMWALTARLIPQEKYRYSLKTPFTELETSLVGNLAASYPEDLPHWCLAENLWKKDQKAAEEDRIPDNFEIQNIRMIVKRVNTVLKGNFSGKYKISAVRERGYLLEAD